MDVVLFSIILFGSLIVTLMLGVPVAFSMSTIALLLGFFFWGGGSSFFGFISAMFNGMQGTIYLAIPMYILMAAILRYSNLADDMYDCMYKWFGRLRGGLAVGSVVICALFAAMVGLTSVATATLGSTALPSMEKRGYDQKFAAGIIMGGACIGIIIPPSVTMLIYSAVTETSPGQMFIAGVIPGLVIAVILIIYSIIYAYKNPTKAPAISKEESATWKEKMTSLRGIILPVIIIVAVIASILTGFATPTEAGAVGVVGSLICAGIKKALSKDNMKKMLTMTTNLSGSIFYIIIASVAYARITSVSGLGQTVANWVASSNLNFYVVLAFICLFFGFIGMFMDAGAALFMTGPIIVPLLHAMGFNMLVFGLVFVLLVCIGSLSPPFGICLFVMKGVAPQLSMNTIYRASIPFIVMYALFIVLFLAVPQLVTWLPGLMMG
ncbi:tripartite transporter large subunit [Clostridia bacterium]|nr:tripartite transporter large subunit [Clostridia bacterium]